MIEVEGGGLEAGKCVVTLDEFKYPFRRTVKSCRGPENCLLDLYYENGPSFGESTMVHNGHLCVKENTGGPAGGTTETSG